MQPGNKSSVEAINRDLRGMDPIESVSPEFDDRQMVEATIADIERVDDILNTDTTLTHKERTELYSMGINLRLDWLYAEHGGRTMPLAKFGPATKQAETFFNQAAAHAYKQHNTHPQDFWAVQTKKQDLLAYEAHRFAADAETTLQGTHPGEMLKKLSEDRMRSAVADGARLMADMARYANGDTELARDARGVLYEQMLITYARQRSYEDQDFDKVFVRSALSREDRPWNGHVFPKRAFDIVIQTEHSQRLLQAKNYLNRDEYAAPIEKIRDPHFAETLENMPKYLVDFKLLVDNPQDPKLAPHLDAARRQLDEVFGVHLKQLV